MKPVDEGFQSTTLPGCFRAGGRIALVLGGRALAREGLMKAARIKGCLRVRPDSRDLPGIHGAGCRAAGCSEDPLPAGDGHRHALSPTTPLSSPEPGSRFPFSAIKMYRDSLLDTSQETFSIGEDGTDILAVLESLADRLGAPVFASP